MTQLDGGKEVSYGAPAKLPKPPGWDQRGVAQDWTKGDHGLFTGARPKHGESTAGTKSSSTAPLNPEATALWREQNADKIAGAAEAHGMTPEAYEAAADANLQRCLDESNVLVKVPSDYMDEILADGRLKSQFEASASGGMFDPPLRAAHETTLFGLSPDMDPKERPIYGFLQTAPASRDVWSSTDGYGDVTLTLKDSVRPRATVTWDDSFPAISATRLTAATLDGYPEMGAAASVPKVFGFFAKSGKVATQFSKSDPLRLASVDAFHGHGSYVEIQVHGGVKVGDIAKVTFSNRPDPVTHALPDEGPYGSRTQIKAQLDQLGIPWEDVQ